MNQISLLSPAKLNLFLHVVGRREDGYHLLQSVMILLNHGDTIHYQLTDSDSISLETNFQDIPEYDNLICQAARLLLPFRKQKKGIAITLDKTLPTGAGLGGGSSNAATTLLALNQLWQCELGEEKLLQLGLQLGADVPFFLEGRSCLVEGIGEQLTPIETDRLWYLVVTPRCHIETGKIFRHEQLTRNTPIKTIAAFLAEGLFSSTRNDCEALVCSLYPEVAELIQFLQKHAPEGAPRLTGTGSSVFIRTQSEQQARSVQAMLPGKWQSFVAQDIPLSPVKQTLSLN